MNFKFKRIQSSITAAFLFLVLFTVLIIAAISFRLTYEAVEKNSREYTYQLIEQVNRNIESYITNMENISIMTLFNNDVREYLTRDDLSSEEEAVYAEKIKLLFDSILSTRQDISSIMVLGYNGRVVISNNRNITELNPYIDPTEQTWYKKAKEAGGAAVISSPHVQNILQDNYYRWVVSLSRELVSADGNEKMGIFVVDLNFSIINDMCSKIKLGKRGYVFIVDREGNIVYHPQQQLIYSNVKREMIDEVLNSTENYFITNEGKDSRIYNIMNSLNTGWKIVGVSYIDELVTNKSEIENSHKLWGFICLATAMIISIILSRRISSPIKHLESLMKQVERGNFDIKVDIESANEIGELGRAFNIMITKIKELMKQNMKEQELKRKSELKALQAQINPHFLYNTLDSIVWMAEAKNSEEVVLMTSALAKLFRLSISKGEEIIPVHNEIEHVRSYLIIQEMRYRNKLEFEIDVDPEIYHFKTLKIILQPLVENSIYHGIKNKEGIGKIKIKGKICNDKILLQVIDNGIGMDQEKIKNIFEKSGKSPGRSGVGVKNVNERIKLYFGKDYGLEFQSEPNKGTTVNVWLPIIE
ncbi:MAG TPA: histidine kinase [Clostridiaceae bacterium]|nr:histidine kinase [Clostridiaceae bacterium]